MKEILITTTQKDLTILKNKPVWIKIYDGPQQKYRQNHIKI